MQVFQTEYNQVIDVSQCPVPYIRLESSRVIPMNIPSY